MHTHTQEPQPVPSQPLYFSSGPDGPDEVDVDLADDDDDDQDEDHDQGDDDDDHQLCHDTIAEGAEYLGAYPSLEAYFRAMLEPELSPGVAWLLDAIDYSEVQRRWESDGSRLVIERGMVFKVGGAQ